MGRNIGPQCRLCRTEGTRLFLKGERCRSAKCPNRGECYASGTATFLIMGDDFPDKDFGVHQACGEPRTPYFIIVKINEDGTHQIVHTQLGNYPGAEPFLELVLKASGLK